MKVYIGQSSLARNWRAKYDWALGGQALLLTAGCAGFAVSTSGYLMVRQGGLFGGLD